MYDMTPIELIAAERQRQVSEEGWTTEHDDEHVDGALAEAAACYASNFVPDRWPWSADWYKPGDGTREGRIRELVKAGALIAAEIARLQRALAAMGYANL